MPDDVYEGGEVTIRRALLLGTMLRVLRDAGRPLTPNEVFGQVEAAEAFTPRELSLNNSGSRRADTFIRFASGWANVVGWITKVPGWQISDAGRAAMDAASSDEELLATIKRIYQDEFNKRQAARSADEVNAKLKRLLAALDTVDVGSWTAYSDLATLAGLANQNVGTFLAENRHPNGHRVLNADGTVAAGFRWPDPNRTDDVTAVLRDEGIEFDDHDRASQAQRLTAYDLQESLGETSDVPMSRAWLVRGNNVNGKNLVPIWLERGSCSVAASQIRSLDLPLSRAGIVAVVEEDYAQKSYNTRNEKVTELDLFLNRIQVGDLVVTNDGASFYIGQISGDAVSVQSTDERSNLRRKVTWANPSSPVDLNDLPASVKPKLSSQHPIVDLTSELAALRALVQQDEPTQLIADKVAAPELRLAAATDELADQLLVTRSWLQECVDLLADRRQIIFYGPPGTGKTFLAQAIAAHLTDSAAVKLVQFHPAYSYEDFFEGYRPALAADGSGAVGFALTPGPFRRLVDAARENTATPYVLIIDEINRANLAKVFGELYFLLEYRDRAIDLLYSAGDEATFTMPPNVFIIGTMNTADRSIALVDAAMRRRFAFKSLHPDTEPTRSMLASWLSRRGLPPTVAAVLDRLNALIKDDDFKIGPSYFMRDSVYRDGGLAVTWETSILPLLEEHHFGDGTDVAKEYALDRILRRVTAGGPAEGGETCEAPADSVDEAPGDE
ncbi:AAA family ATPase [Cellulomonas sp. NTE-D12]|uniref:AAA family ATPase n=1 Tax=Cellulomonas sp. NTE-D12 TaxID=2962632 RepID=UPI003081C165|nr:GTPase subunit of restriction endonuclease [Cellulomonas sp. NTE-D12]